MELQRSLRGGAMIVWFLLAAVGTRAIHTSQLDDAPWWVGDDWNPSIPLYDRLERNEDDPPIRDSVVQEGGNISTWSADGKAAAEIDQSVMDTHLNERGTNETEHGYLIFGSDFPHVVNKDPPVKAFNGEPFAMRCPIESSLPGTLYYWQRYKGIDRETQIGFSPDAEFSEGGRVWSVDVLSQDHNGMYECLAVNELGHAVFHNAIDFFISVLSCSNHAPTISFAIEHRGSSTHYEGDHVELECTATAVDYHKQPFWYHNGTVCKNPTYYLVNSSFDVSACRWTSILKVLNLTAETAGIYDCTAGVQGTNTTLLLAEPASGVREKVMVAVVVGVGIAMVVVGLYCKNWAHSGPQPSEEPPYEGFEYDAFVSAHDEAREFVLESILPPLESGPAPYRLCWHSRDFIPGVPIMEQIAHTMARSRKIIFVFSEHFSQSQFCCAELELAMSRYMRSCTRCILPVALEDGSVPEELKMRLTYLPVLSAREEVDVAGEIAKVMGEPIPVVMDRVDDSFVEE